METEKPQESTHQLSEESSSGTVQLLQTLRSGNSQMRRQAARALGKIHSDSAVSGLLQTMAHPNLEVRGWAAWALGQIGEPAVSGLVQSLSQEDSEICQWATWALGEIGSDSAVKVLLQALTHKDSKVRWRAASALGKIGSQSAVSLLLRSLNDPDDYVRGRAASALGKIGSEIAVPRLRKALHNQSSYVLWRVTEALGQIGSPSAVVGLLQALKHSDSDVREATVAVLGQVNSETAVLALLKAVNDSDHWVRGKVASVFGEIGTETAVTGLLQLLNDSDSYVRVRADEALQKIRSQASLHRVVEDAVELASTSESEQLSDPGVLMTDSPEKQLPTLFITSYNQASEHLLCTTRGPLVKHVISIGSPGVVPPHGYTQVSHRLRLEFDDINTPVNDPEYVLPTAEDIRKVIDFVPLISHSGGNLLIHCQAGISRSAAVALTVFALLLGADKEEEALAYVLKVRPQARPNQWMVALADEALGREGKLISAVQNYREGLGLGTRD